MPLTPSPLERERSLTVAADVVHLSALRAHTAGVARSAGAPDHITEQLELIVSELATNEIQHAGASDVTVAVEPVPTGWQVDVSSTDHSVCTIAPQLPGTHEPTGRGLFLVAAMTNGVDAVIVDGTRHLRCVVPTS